jgi:hypothetical protein
VVLSELSEVELHQVRERATHVREVLTGFSQAITTSTQQGRSTTRHPNAVPVLT